MYYKRYLLFNSQDWWMLYWNVFGECLSQSTYSSIIHSIANPVEANESLGSRGYWLLWLGIHWDKHACTSHFLCLVRKEDPLDVMAELLLCKMYNKCWPTSAKCQMVVDLQQAPKFPKPKCFFCTHASVTWSISRPKCLFAFIHWSLGKFPNPSAFLHSSIDHFYSNDSAPILCFRLWACRCRVDCSLNSILFPTTSHKQRNLRN